MLTEFEYYKLAIDAIKSHPDNAKLNEHEFGGKLRMYDHAEGYDVMSHEKKQWLYLKCRRCGCELSLRKLL